MHLLAIANNRIAIKGCIPYARKATLPGGASPNSRGRERRRVSVAMARFYRSQIMGSSVGKRSVIISGRKTSVSAETEFWNALKDIAAFQERCLSDLITDIDRSRQAGNLSSAIRLFVLDHFKRVFGESRG
jgi:predicted DNA-binding ribbon-helix-helix protein